MTTYNSKYFGKIDFKQLKECYETDIEFNNKMIEITINSTSSITQSFGLESIKLIDDYIDNLAKNEAIIRDVIYEDFNIYPKGFVRSYINGQIKDQDKEDIADLIAEVDKKLKKNEKLLSVLYLLRIGFYPEKEVLFFANYDYTIDEDLTDELLVVVENKDNSIAITLES
jgi:hypothetical protein